MAIKDFIKNNIQSGVFFDGTYGIEIEAETQSKYPIPQFSFWDVKDDNSLRMFGKEYVLKVPLKYDYEITEALNEFKNKLAGVPFIENSISTSVHVHTNILPETWKTLGNFLTIYTLVENIFIEYSGEYRRNNLFCLPIRSVPFVYECITDIFTRVNKKDYRFTRNIHSDHVKYAALNLGTIGKFGSVEIRSFRGTTNIDLIKTWVSIINNILEFSRQDITPITIIEAYRNMGSDLFRDIFQGNWKHLKHPDEVKLLHPNLWYASGIAYNLNADQWNALDVLPKVTKPTDKQLNDSARKHFGVNFADLNPNQVQFVMAQIELQRLIFHEEFTPAAIPMAQPPTPNLSWTTFTQANPAQGNQLVEALLDDEPDGFYDDPE